MIPFILRYKQITDKYTKDEMTVYAAQASFFIILSVFPFLMLLLTLVQILPNLNKDNLTDLILALLPYMSESIHEMVLKIINDLYTKSPGTILSITAITALWSASKGMLSVERGLNRVHGSTEKRGYLISRLVCVGYTIAFILACIMTLVFLVFGDQLQKLIIHFFPILEQTTHYIINFRTLWSLTLLTLCFAGLYTYLPRKKLNLRKQLPGAVFSTICWILFSFGFSIYFNNFSNFSYMYGSLTAIVLVMLWLYFCICILFLGAEINCYFENRRKIQKQQAPPAQNGKPEGKAHPARHRAGDS